MCHLAGEVEVLDNPLMKADGVDGDRAHLVTRQDFGCVAHEPR